ncbi:uncharacterized protein LOC125505188 isoform X1 [Dendroctonus ponderosae]|uniref:uncharacterized protein LOC125505188 isoform X1 n=1 Tax=Dendroctonus ponderosae TaxID=77166 RepID=UPI00203563D4|nr:uncharacterized protein LOC125505188 isoform X1 [Dendroctonus ponderosae]
MFGPRVLFLQRRNVLRVSSDSSLEGIPSSYAVEFNLVKFIRIMNVRVTGIREEHVEHIWSGDNVPHKMLLELRAQTAIELSFYLKVCMKVLVVSNTDLDQIAHAYMKLDTLINIKKEVLMHYIVIKTIKNFQKKLNIKRKMCYDFLFPICYGVTMTLRSVIANLPDQYSAIVVDNVELHGYTPHETGGSRYSGFSYNTSKKILRTMARFHAGPIAMRIKKKSKFTRKIIPILNLEVKKYAKAPPFQTLFQELISCGLTDCEITRDHIVEIRDALHCYRLHDRNKNQTDQIWNTLSHSRYWNPYIMTKEGKESILLDTSRISYDSCCTNIISFMFTSVDPEVIEQQPQFENLLTEYYDAFKRTLEKHQISLEEYTWNNFRTEFDTVGRRMCANIFLNIKASYCQIFYPQGGAIVFNDEYHRRLKAAVKMMAVYDWINISVSDSDSSSW